MKSKLFFATLIFIGAAAVGGITLNEVGMAQTLVPPKPPCETSRYRIFRPGSTYIMVMFKDIAAGKTLRMIVDNNDFASFLAAERGFRMDKLGRFIDNDAYMRFRTTVYPDLMERNEGKVLEFDLGTFEKFIGRTRFGKESAGKQFVENFLFEQPMTLVQLRVRNEKELIDKYFDFDNITGEGTLNLELKYRNEMSKNPAFIATLLDLGFVVGSGDYLPLLWIKRCR